MIHSTACSGRYLEIVNREFVGGFELPLTTPSRQNYDDLRYDRERKGYEVNAI